jgi:hypothetical protein
VRFLVRLSGKLAQSLGVKSGATLSGSGVVNFARARSRWSLSLPSGLGGGKLSVVTDGTTTYVSPGHLVPGRRSWLRVRARQLRRITRVGLVGRLAALLNPITDVTLVASAARHVKQVTTARGARVGATAASVANTADANCSATPGLDLSSPVDLQTLTGLPSQLRGVAKDYVDTYHDALRAFRDVQMFAQVQGRGLLSSLGLTASVLESADMTITLRYCQIDQPAGLQDPASASVTDLQSYLPVDPCLVGLWNIVGGLPGSQGDPTNPANWIANGLLFLEIGPDGAASLNYSEVSVFPATSFAPPLPPTPFDPPLDIDYVFPGQQAGVFGTAEMNLVAPLVAQVVAHKVFHVKANKLVWTPLSEQVFQLIAGHYFSAPTPPRIINNPPDPPREIPQLPIVSNNPPTLTDIGVSDVGLTNYDCNKSTLQVKLPVGNDQELRFARISDSSAGTTSAGLSTSARFIDSIPRTSGPAIPDGYVTISSGEASQTFRTFGADANAPIPVLSAKPNFDYPAGSTISAAIP